jgi:hypothetical protein
MAIDGAQLSERNRRDAIGLPILGGGVFGAIGFGVGEKFDYSHWGRDSLAGIAIGLLIGFGISLLTMNSRTSKFNKDHRLG